MLVALAADAWNDGRLDRIDEVDYLARFQSAIASDTANFRFILDWMDRKETGLRRLDALLSLPGSDFSPDTVLIDLTAAANFGWNVGPLVGTATFEDLRSSGRIGLIRDSGLRSQIIEYYETAEGEDRRMQARRTEYPHISYQLVPFARDFEPGSSTMMSLRRPRTSKHCLAGSGTQSYRGTFLLKRTVLTLFEAQSVNSAKTRLSCSTLLRKHSWPEAKRARLPATR